MVLLKKAEIPEPRKLLWMQPRSETKIWKPLEAQGVLECKDWRTHSLISKSHSSRKTTILGRKCWRGSVPCKCIFLIPLRQLGRVHTSSSSIYPPNLLSSMLIFSSNTMWTHPEVINVLWASFDLSGWSPVIKPSKTATILVRFHKSVFSRYGRRNHSVLYEKAAVQNS